MKFFPKWDKKKKQKEKDAASAEERARRNGNGEAGLENTINVRLSLERHGGLDNCCIAEVTELPLSDIISLSRDFRELLCEFPDFTSKKQFVTSLKSIASEMIQKEFAVNTVDPAIGQLAFVQRLLKEPPPVRTRLALAVLRFCGVVELELENEEIMRGTGFLEALRGGGAANEAQPPQASGSSMLLKPVSPAADFSVAKIYHQLITVNELPSLEEMGELISRTTKLLREESNIVTLSIPCIVVGDIHGQWRDLVDSIIAAGGPLDVDKHTATHPEEEDVEVVGRRNYLFLGDYVDRGPHSLHCLTLLFASKLLAPDRVFLLRGNHESSETNSKYGFLQECFEHYPLSSGDNESDRESVDLEWGLPEHPIWVLANEAFLSLPLCAVVTGPNPTPDKAKNPLSTSCRERVAICAMHGGLSPFVSNSLDGILAIDRFREIEDGPLADITWADPITAEPSEGPSEGNGNCTEGAGRQAQRLVRHCVPFNYNDPVPAPIPSVTKGYVFSARGRGHNFGEDVTLQFLSENRLSFLVRAHQCVQEGYQWQHQNRILTLFSAPNYCGLGNKGAILILHASGEPELVQFEALESEVAPGGLPAPLPPKSF
ncbi:putative serine/threonine protein phosphatase [Trypanosoma conorhini]|uniref:Serine/threonine-protein phosphatase n=1 Tax=Trypanosoma conorhini TaxID=83891 RepID=A0A422NEJ2_9TRYP|nr:putative serine/threonine protein phosphatase [Trypanosoma conorhini]RNF03878.1 putative serine/threonine protein phosphatase [Trypanosoma conorhini]